MKVDVAVRNQLLADDDVVSLVGDRIYFDYAPKDALSPFITLKLVSEVPDSKVPDCFYARVQVSCWSLALTQSGMKSPEEVNAVADVVKLCLHHSDLEGLNEEWLVNDDESLWVMDSKCALSQRLIEPGTEYYHIPCDFVIEYRRI
jgi:hypothetical protein